MADQIDVSEIDADQPKELRDLYLLYGPKKYCFPRTLNDILPKLYNFKTRPDDVWIYGCPRTGTTMAQEIIWLIMNDFDYERAAAEVLDIRFPLLEREMALSGDGLFKRDPNCTDENALRIAKRLERPATDELEEVQGPRLIKTHVPLSLGPSNVLESGCKILYLTRNPKDVAVSSYIFGKAFQFYDGDFEQFYKWFEAGLSFSCPFFEHVKEGWALRNHPNVLFLFYEEYTKNLRESIKKIADFLNKSITEEQIDRLLEHLKIDNFRKNKSVNNDHLRVLGVMLDENDQFIRKGKSGGWRDYFTGPMMESADKWIEKNLENTDLKFPVK